MQCNMQDTIQYSTIQYNTIQYNAYKFLHTFLAPEQGIRFGFSTPEQGGKSKRPVAHTCLIKVESLPPGYELAEPHRNIMT